MRYLIPRMLLPEDWTKESSLRVSKTPHSMIMNERKRFHYIPHGGHEKSFYCPSEHRPKMFLLQRMRRDLKRRGSRGNGFRRKLRCDVLVLGSSFGTLNYLSQKKWVKSCEHVQINEHARAPQVLISLILTQPGRA